MEFEYDAEVDGAFIWLTTFDDAKKKYDKEIWPVELNEEVGFLLDEQGRVVGIEILPASKYIAEQFLIDTYSGDGKDSAG